MTEFIAYISIGAVFLSSLAVWVDGWRVFGKLIWWRAAIAVLCWPLIAAYILVRFVLERAKDA